MDEKDEVRQPVPDDAAQADAVAEPAAETAAEPAVPARTRRDDLVDRLNAGRETPDDYSDDDALYDRVMADYDDYESDINRYNEESKKLLDLMDQDPRNAGLILSGDPIGYMIEEFGDDLREILDSEDVTEEYAKRKKAYLDKVAKNKEFETQSEANLQESIAALEAFQKEHSLSDDETQEVFKWVVDIAENGLMNKYTKDAYDAALKALHYDRDVTAADHEGEVRGRNAKITADMRKAQPRTELPGSMSGRGGGAQAEKPKPKGYNPFRHTEE